MPRHLLIIPIMLLQGLMSFSQNDPAKIIAEAQRKLDSVLKNNPAIQKYSSKSNQSSAVNIPNLPAGISPATTYAKKPDTAYLSKIKIPGRNTKALASLPSKIFSRTEMITWMHHTKTKILDAMAGSGGNTPLSFKETDINIISNEAVICWYAGNPDRAIELAMDAAEKDPDNYNALNNLSGILTMCGFPYRSVPVLEYLSNQDPDNSTVNNNLGQSYFIMGDVQKAKEYLNKAIASSRYHPQANFTLAYIEYANGNKPGAQSYCENSLRGAFSNEAWTMLRAIHPNAKLMDLIRHRYKQPDFFNPHKYPLPEQCERPEDAERLKQEYADYKKMLMAVKDKYSRLLKSEEIYVSKNMANEMMKRINQKESPLRPFGAFANAVYWDINYSHGEDIIRLKTYDSSFKEQVNRLKENYKSEKKEIDKKFESRLDKAGEGNPDPTLDREICDAHNKLATKYLPDFADLFRRRQQKWITTTINYYNDFAFWCYMASVNDHEYHRMFYQLVVEYLTMLENIAATEFIGCTKKFTDSIEEKPYEFEEGKCPFEAKINVETKNEEGEKETPAKFEIDCEKFTAELELGEGVTFKSKTTPSGNTTLAFGAGLSKNGKIAKILPVDVSGSMETYISFGSGQPIDIGFKWDYGLKLPGYLGGKNSAGWSVSLNNGVEFHGDGTLVNYTSNWASKNIFNLDPPAQQMNPNIRLFNH